MVNLFYSLAIIIGSLIIGQVVYYKTKKMDEIQSGKVKRTIFLMRNIAFFGLSPFSTINAFWIVDLSSISIVAVPFIGLGALVFGSITAILLSKIFKHNRKDRGAMFCCGSSTNVGTIGALICYTLLGEVGFAFNALYKLLEQPYLYLVMYPSAKLISGDNKSKSDKWYLKLIKDPIIVVYFSSIALGLIFNFTGIVRPRLISEANSIFIPLASFLLIVAIGYTMHFSKITQYKKEVVSISILKYALTPLIVITASLVFGLDKIGNGVLFKTMIIMSALPTGFNSLIPTQMYKLNTNLANSCWIVTTTLLVVVVPIIWLIIK